MRDPNFNTIHRTICASSVRTARTLVYERRHCGMPETITLPDVSKNWEQGSSKIERVTQVQNHSHLKSGALFVSSFLPWLWP